MHQPVKVFNDLTHPAIPPFIHSFCAGKSGIYGFYNHITNQIYLGSAVDLYVIFSGHIFYNKTNIRLKRSINSYELSVFRPPPPPFDRRVGAAAR